MIKSMHKQPILRKALWLAYGKKCFYTGEPIYYANMDIDHIIPSSKWKKDSEKLKKEYDLDPDFEIDGYKNLVPCKRTINRKKSDNIFKKKAIHYYINLTSHYYDKFISAYRELTKANSINGISRILSKIYSNEKYKYSEIMKRIYNDGLDILWDTEMPNPVDFLINENSVRGVNTCRGFKCCKDKGMGYQDNYSGKSSWSYECIISILENISRVEPPIKSFVSDPYIGVLDIGLIPSELFTNCINLSEVRNNVISGSTIQDLIHRKEAIVKELTSNSLTIKNQDESCSVHIFEVLRGDFDNDKCEDILIYVYTFTTGTFGFGETYVLSKLNKQDKFIVSRLANYFK